MSFRVRRPNVIEGDGFSVELGLPLGIRYVSEGQSVLLDAELLARRVKPERSSGAAGDAGLTRMSGRLGKRA